MPEAKNEFTSDYYLAKYILNPSAKKICFLNPNIITLSGTLLIIPIVSNLLQDKSTSIFILLMIIRHFVDSLDGSVARNCNKSTKFGAILDILSDTITNLILFSVIVYIIFKRRKNLFPNILITIALLILVIFCCVELKKELFYDRSGIITGKSNYFDNKLHEYIHDNLLILWLGFSIFIKYYIMHC